MDHRLYLTKFKIDIKTASVINGMNLAFTELITTEGDANMTRPNDILYVEAIAATKEAKYSLKPT